jgi:two-component sensor histidine kinase
MTDVTAEMIALGHCKRPAQGRGRLASEVREAREKLTWTLLSECGFEVECERTEIRRPCLGRTCFTRSSGRHKLDLLESCTDLASFRAHNSRSGFLANKKILGHCRKSITACRPLAQPVYRRGSTSGNDLGGDCLAPRCVWRPHRAKLCACPILPCRCHDRDDFGLNSCSGEGSCDADDSGNPRFPELAKPFRCFGAHTVESYKEYSNDIHASGQHLLMPINEILDLSRIEAGQFELTEEAIALAHIMSYCRRLLRLRAKKREISVEQAVEPDLPRLWADERAIRQVILNVLSNAIKFTRQGGTIKIKIGWTASGGQYVAVRYSGPGIPEDEIPIIMSYFGRGSHAQTHAEEGSGLGLPIAKGLVKLHGGSFTLKSKLREGTEVIVISAQPDRGCSARGGRK